MAIFQKNIFGSMALFKRETSEITKKNSKDSEKCSEKIHQAKGPETEISKGSFLYPDRMRRDEDTYRTESGRCYDFSFQRAGECFSVFIHSTPENAYSEKPHIVAGFSFQDGRIDPAAIGCTMAIRTYGQARKIAAIWAESVDINQSAGALSASH